MSNRGGVGPQRGPARFQTAAGWVRKGDQRGFKPRRGGSRKGFCVVSNRGGVGPERRPTRFQTTAGWGRQEGPRGSKREGPGTDRIGCGFVNFNYEADPRGRNPAYEAAKRVRCRQATCQEREITSLGSLSTDSENARSLAAVMIAFAADQVVRRARGLGRARMERDGATTAARAGQQYVLQATTVAVGVWQYDWIHLTKARKPAAGRQHSG